MKPALPLSVVVPARDRAGETVRLLESLAAAPVRFEIVLVDDGSKEPLEATCARALPELEIVHVRHARARGPAAARNAGVRAASADIIAFTDNDCVVTPEWPERIHTYASRLPARFAGVGGRTVPLGADLISRYFGYHKILDPWVEGGRVLYVVTANAAFRRSALEAVGGFDETLRAPGGEDPGLCFKLTRAGYDLAYDAEAVVFHEFRPALTDFARTFYRYGAGCRHQLERHGPR